MAENKIVLHPIDPWAILQDPYLLLDALRERGLIGASFSHFGELHYKAGPRFRELVSFKAAPSGPGQPDWNVSLLETMADPAFLGGANVQLPQCPGCQGRIADWRTQLSQWQLDRHHYAWVCPRCGRKLKVEQLEWLRSCGIARYALDLWGIREGEAVPSPELLEALRSLTAQTWTYFYYRL